MTLLAAIAWWALAKPADGLLFHGPGGMYSNLSCPFEWSKYSCVHMGGNFQKQAELGAEYFGTHSGEIQDAFGSMPPPDSRTVMIGDSTLRQLFISIACLSSPFLAESRVDWAEDHWPCHGSDNCISHGVQSGFNVGSLRYTNGHELHYLPHSGTLHLGEGAIFARMRRELAVFGGATLGPNTALRSQCGGRLSARDTVVAGVGIHDELVESTINDLSALGEAMRSLPDQPRLLLVASLTQHFDTEDGTWRGPKASSACVPAEAQNPREVREAARLQPGKNIDEVISWGDAGLGAHHIGNGDCSHYCMPGVPDTVAARLFRRLRGI
uniref:SGNH domain-containing protein n=1 Tax=Alexandrium catenella TaxID=2925 RepID=A0A7S1WSH4_ALECA|eukprot:CAMPEP_0171219696 /NCGR_PEP_ID=MMETSP0790-20130122/33851_1 /TAXON_ID=2925 /ORGANISM="Alexandrium catenella, Strain OF101" /LENGTH=325 /DNA_ID=CAMNT_0011685559 /DNA_START=110 /DNA_END=1087 /DNA_ORIENTATION=-